MQVVFLLAFLACSAMSSLAQNVMFTGSVKDTTGQGIADANVLVQDTQAVAVQFTFTDNDGKFALELPDSIVKGNYFIQVNILGYESHKQKIVATQHDYLFILKESFNELKTVKVESAAIRARGDTLSYNVKSFSREEDRSIGDVIRRLPGMSVSEDGRISFNGKAIDNLLIHSDDLMDGRYGLAARSIGKEIIKSIDVIQNYQSISTLKDRAHSDKTVINLVLQNEKSVKLSGQAMISGGSPKLTNDALNLILLNKKFKMLNSIKYNNSGENYQFDFKDLSSSAVTQPKNLLSDAVKDNPGVPGAYIFRNNSFAINTNNLYNTKDSLQLRANVGLLLDKNTLNYQSVIENYVQGDTIVYRESQDVFRKPYAFTASINLLQNKANYYLKNQVQLALNGYTNSSNLNFNGNAFQQNLNMQAKTFSNDLQWVPGFLKRDILSVNWAFNYHAAPQDLFIYSGIDSLKLNNGKAYSGLHQYASIPSWHNRASINYYVNNARKIRMNYLAGLENQWQQLNSTLTLKQKNATENTYAGDAGNKLDWLKHRAFVQAGFWRKTNTWNIHLTLPFIAQQIHFKQNEYSLDKKQNNFLIMPELKAEYMLNPEHILNATYRYNQNFGGIEDVFQGIVVGNFRNIYSNDAFIREAASNELALRYEMKKSTSMLFFNAGFTYKNSLRNSVVSTNFDKNIQRTVFLPLENTQENISANVALSKYFFPLKTKLSLNASVQKQHYEQYINEKLLPIQSNLFNLGLEAETLLLNMISLNYAGNFNHMMSKTKLLAQNKFALNNHATVLNQHFSLGITPGIPVTLSLQGRHQVNKNITNAQNNFFFADARLRYRPKKIGVDIDLEVNNLFDQQEFNTYYLSANQVFYENYQLRGRMLLAKATFNF